MKMNSIRVERGHKRFCCTFIFHRVSYALLNDNIIGKWAILNAFALDICIVCIHNLCMLSALLR